MRYLVLALSIFLFSKSSFSNERIVKTEVIKPSAENLEIISKIRLFTSTVENYKAKDAIRLLRSKDFAFYLDARIKGEPVLIFAIRNKLNDLAQELITQGANLNSADFEKKTPLIRAIEVKNNFLTKLIIGAGADTGIKDKSGLTALDYAKQNKFNEVVDLLQKKQG